MNQTNQTKQKDQTDQTNQANQIVAHKVKNSTLVEGCDVNYEKGFVHCSEGLRVHP